MLKSFKISGLSAISSVLMAVMITGGGCGGDTSKGDYTFRRHLKTCYHDADLVANDVVSLEVLTTECMNKKGYETFDFKEYKLENPKHADELASRP